MSKKLSQTEQELHDQIYELEKKIKLLETELKRSNIARDAYSLYDRSCREEIQYFCKENESAYGDYRPN